MTVYVIYHTDGDRYEPWGVEIGYVMSEQEANDTVESLNNTIPQFSQRVADIESRLCSYFYHLRNTGRGELATEWFESLTKKLELKYPNLSSEYGIENSYYYYKEIEAYE